MDYDDLLKRGRSSLPKDIVDKKRFEVPEVKRQTEGKKTIILNFGEICNVINRDPDIIARYIFREAGTAGARADVRLVLSGSFSAETLNNIEIFA